MPREVRTKWRAVPLLILSLCAFRPVAADEQPLPMADYCEVTKRVLLLSAVEWKERLAAAEVNQGDERSLWRALDTITSRHRSYRAKIYGQFGTSAGTVGRFSTDNKDEIRAYLDESPQIRNEIESARQTVTGLIDQFEALMARSRGGQK